MFPWANTVYWVEIISTGGAVLSIYALWSEHHPKKKIYKEEKTKALPLHVRLTFLIIGIAAIGNCILTTYAAKKAYEEHQQLAAQKENVNCTLAQSVGRIEDVVNRLNEMNGTMRAQDIAFQESSRVTLTQLSGVMEEVASVTSLAKKQTHMLDSTSKSTIAALTKVQVGVNSSVEHLEQFMTDADLIIFPLNGIRVKFMVAMVLSESMAHRFRQEQTGIVDDLFIDQVRHDMKLKNILQSPYINVQGKFSINRIGTSKPIVFDTRLTETVRPLYHIISDTLYLFYDCPVDIQSSLGTRINLTLKDIEACSFTLHMASFLYQFDHKYMLKGYTPWVDNNDSRLVNGIVISFISNVRIEDHYIERDLERSYHDEELMRFDEYSARVRPFRYNRSVLTSNRCSSPLNYRTRLWSQNHKLFNDEGKEEIQQRREGSDRTRGCFARG